MKNLPTFDEKLVTARQLSAKGRYNEATSLYLELLKLGIEKESLLKELVRLHMRSGQAEKAIDFLCQLTEAAPEELSYYLDLANLRERLGFLNEAIESYRKLLKREPRLPNAWYNLARLLKRSGSYEEALGSYRQALRYEISGSEEVYNNIAVIYSELHREELSMENFEHALKVNPKYIPALFNLGGKFEEVGKKTEALQQYRKILAIDSRYYPALCRIANMVDVVDYSDSIIAQVGNALSHPDVDVATREELLFAQGKLLDACGKFSSAFESYREANELGVNRFPVYDKKSQEARIDDLIRYFGKVQFPKKNYEYNVNPVFICGMYRSGSTLVEQILSGHSRVTAGGELDFFSGLAKKVYSESRLLKNASDAKFFKGVTDGYLNLLADRFLDFDLVTDKRPDNYLHVGLIKLAFPKSKIIWTRRGLLDNCLSIYFQYLGGDMNYSVKLDAIGHYYVQQVRLMEFWRSLFPDSIFLLQYENLVESPESEIRKLLRFLGLVWEDSCLDFSSRKNYVKTASIWQVRQSIYSRSSGRYENYIQFLGDLEKYLI